MEIQKESFGKTADGRETFLYTLQNEQGMKVKLSDYGCAIVSILIPDGKDNLKDVVLGYDDVHGYEDNTPFFGVVIGRNANRIAGAVCEIDGKEYSLERNDNENNLHTSLKKGFHTKIWSAEPDEKENSISFRYHSPDGENGFPGNCDIKVSYVLNEENALEIHYEGKTDKRTVMNLTNHSYFNLMGEASGDILDHKLWLKAKNYTPVVSGAIPTGEIAAVNGTPMDFTQLKTIGDEIEADFEQLKLTGGYDHNYVLDKECDGIEKIAVVETEHSKYKMEVYTDLPGVQFYAGNFINDKKGKNGTIYRNRTGLCLETQYFPNAVNEENFISPILEPDEIYRSCTIYKFS